MPASHCRLWFHVIFATKARRAWLDRDLREEMIPYLGGIARNLRVKLCAANGWREHLHLLIQCPAKLALSNVVRELKSNSSRWVHERFPSHRDFSWQEGFAAFTVSHSQIPAVKKYIRDQETHHVQKGFGEEYEQFLEVHDLLEEFREQERYRFSGRS